MNRRPPIYPVFIPNSGCPFQCIYCDQRRVTGISRHLRRVEQAVRQVESFANHARNEATSGEIAFYGGTFTGLARRQQDQLLMLAQRYVDQGLFSGIRFSTRPDHIDANTLQHLAGYAVSAVELGIQSLSDTVLRSSQRGYDRQQALDAMELLGESPYKLGVQLMLGLPSDTPERFLASVQATIRARPDFVRVYPTLVFPGTELASWVTEGRYLPLSLKEAVDWCVPAYDACVQAGITVARLGLLLPSKLAFDSATVAGPWHPAYGQLVRSAWWRERIDASLRQWPNRVAGRVVVIRVGQRYSGDALGWKRQNIDHWRQKWNLKDVCVQRCPEEASMGFDLVING
jgi:histone acetyltransferase (RNA polymerase elongator complex component)